MNLVSIVIPCYNSEAFVARAIDCALDQTYRNCEIILVDNNSSDGTLKLLQSYAANYPDKINVFEESKRGAPAARNKGLKEAKGEWIQFLDSDDEILPDKVLNQMKVAENNDFDLIVGNRIKYKATRNGVSKVIRQADSTNAWKALIESKLNSTSAMLWKRAALIKVDGWNEEMIYSSDEYELIFRMLKRGGEIGFSNTTETIVITRNESVNRSKDNEKLLRILTSFVQLRCDIRNYLKTSGKLTRELDRAFKRRIYYRLSPYRSRIPEFVNTQLHDLHIHPPLTHLIKLNIKRLKKLIAGR